MDFGLVLQTDPPASAVVDLMQRAERNGFSYGWTFDSAVLWQEPFVIYSRILDHTERLIVGPMVTNPGTRTWEVTASTFATLNDMYGNRTVCGIGRGDSAMRVAGRKPNTLARLGEAIGVIRDLAEGREAEVDGSAIRLPWVQRRHAARCGWPPTGPRRSRWPAEKADGFILQLADPFLTEWMVKAVRQAAADAGRDPASVTICVAAPAYVTDGTEQGSRTPANSAAGSAAWSATTSPTSSARYGEHSEAVPEELTAYIKDRQGYDYAHHGRAGNPDTAFVPDEIVDRFCLIGTAEQHIEKLQGPARRWASTSSRSTPCTTPARRSSTPTASRSSRLLGRAATRDRPRPTRSPTPTAAHENWPDGAVPDDGRFANADLRPVPVAERHWTTYNFTALWVGMAHNIPSWTLASGLVALGMDWKQAVLTIALANVIVLVPMLLTGHAGPKYGIPFPVLARASFGLRGANLPALVRAAVACAWFGIQTWIGGEGIFFLAGKLFGHGWANASVIGGHPWTQWLSFVVFWAARTRHHRPGDGDPAPVRELGRAVRTGRRRRAADLDRGQGRRPRPAARPALQARLGRPTSGRSSSRP